MEIKGLIERVTATLHRQNSGTVASESPAEFLAQVERVANSPLFHGSEALPKLLRYLAKYSLLEPIGHLKEYQIATEVLGRAPDFDPQSDACVRVQVGRLRGKLAEYYETVGAQDEILLQIPKGGYSLVFEKRVLDSVQPHLTAAEPVPLVSPFRQPRFLTILVLSACLPALLTAAFLLHFLSTKSELRSGTRQGATTAAMSAFWSPFLNDQDGPFVVYSNAAFVGNASTGMRYFDARRDQPSQENHHYTGIGELAGAVKLGVLFQQFGRPFRLKRGSLFSLDDALQNDLIFLGSPTENPQLSKLLTTHEFAFDNVPTDPQHRFGVVATHTHAGEPTSYVTDTSPGGVDYAIIALAKGVNPSHRILILEGTSTLTTQAAVDFICDPTSISDLEHRLGASGKAPQATFEAVIQVKIADDVPLESHLVALQRTQ
jgi:hypothetical protein